MVAIVLVQASPLVFFQRSFTSFRPTEVQFVDCGHILGAALHVMWFSLKPEFHSAWGVMLNSCWNWWFLCDKWLLKITDSGCDFVNLPPLSFWLNHSILMGHFNCFAMCAFPTMLTRLSVLTHFLIMSLRGAVIVYWIRFVVFCCHYTLLLQV